MIELLLRIWDNFIKSPHILKKSIFALALIVLVWFFLDYVDPLRAIKIQRIDETVRLKEAYDLLPRSESDSLEIKELIESTMKELTLLELTVLRFIRCWTYSYSAFHTERINSISLYLGVVWVLLLDFKSKRTKSRKIYEYMLIVLLVFTVIEIFILIDFFLFIDLISDLYAFGCNGWVMYIFRSLFFAAPFVIIYGISIYSKKKLNNG